MTVICAPLIRPSGTFSRGEKGDECLRRAQCLQKLFRRFFQRCVRDPTDAARLDDENMRKGWCVGRLRVSLEPFERGMLASTVRQKLDSCEAGALQKRRECRCVVQELVPPS